MTRTYVKVFKMLWLPGYADRERCIQHWISNALQTVSSLYKTGFHRFEVTLVNLSYRSAFSSRFIEIWCLIRICMKSFETYGWEQKFLEMQTFALIFLIILKRFSQRKSLIFVFEGRIDFLNLRAEVQADTIRYWCLNRKWFVLMPSARKSI